MNKEVTANPYGRPSSGSLPRHDGRSQDKWIENTAPYVLVGGIVLSTLGFLMAFLWVPPVGGATVNGVELIGDVVITQKLLLSQKIFYFHMPVAITSFLALLVGGVYSVRYLMTKEIRYDQCARVAMEVALVFVIMTMVTGEMWTRFEWGVWWTWDPRLTTYLILMIIVIAYFVLRGGIDELERRNTYSAVIAIFACVDVPICLLITRLIPSSVHPVVLREGGMTPEMGLCVGLCLLGMVCIGFALYQARLRQIGLSQRIADLTGRLTEDSYR